MHEPHSTMEDADSIDSSTSEEPDPVSAAEAETTVKPDVYDRMLRTASLIAARHRAERQAQRDAQAQKDNAEQQD